MQKYQVQNDGNITRKLQRPVSLHPVDGTSAHTGKDMQETGSRMDRGP